MRKLIKKVIREAVGVPEGALESSEDLYEKILSILSSMDEIPSDQYRDEFNVDYNIVDMEINKIFIRIDFHEANVDDVALISMGSGSQSKLSEDDSYVLINVSPKKVAYISVEFAINENSTIEDVVNYFTRDQINVTSVIAHELKHSFDTFKGKRKSVIGRARYTTYTSLSFPIPPVNKFMFYFYFTTYIENLVRPTEVASIMKSKKIVRDEFYEFLLNNDTYKRLSEIKNWTFDGFKQELHEHMEDIDNFLEMVEETGLETDEEKINRVLELVYINIVNHTGKNTMRILANSPIEAIFGLKKDKEDFFQSIINKLLRFDNNKMGFYIYSEKMFHKVATKVMKKLAKLYSLIESNPSSIQNWELHHKINKTDRNIQKESLFKRKK